MEREIERDRVQKRGEIRIEKSVPSLMPLHALAVKASGREPQGPEET